MFQKGMDKDKPEKWKQSEENNNPDIRQCRIQAKIKL